MAMREMINYHIIFVYWGFVWSKMLRNGSKMLKSTAQALLL